MVELCRTHVETNVFCSLKRSFQIIFVFIEPQSTNEIEKIVKKNSQILTLNRNLGLELIGTCVEIYMLLMKLPN